MTSRLSRRAWLTSLGVGLTAARAHPAGAVQAARPAPARPAAHTDTLLLKDFQPRSMLVVPETPVDRARFPVVDVHTHPTVRARRVAGVPHGEAVRVDTPPADALAIMERRNLRTIVDLTGGVAFGARGNDPHLPAAASRPVRRVHRAVVRSHHRRRLSAMAGRRARARQEGRCAWSEGAEGPRTLPASAGDDRTRSSRSTIRGSIPCGMPAVRSVCRWRSTSRDPDGVLPADRSLQRALRGAAAPSGLVIRRQGLPRSTQSCSRRGTACSRAIQRRRSSDCTSATRRRTSPAASQALDRFPNLHVEIAARIGELGRQPRASRRFFDKYQDRILFGTDGAGSDALLPVLLPLPRNGDEYFDTAPGPVPAQGRWRIYGVGLPDPVLKKVLLGERRPAALALSRRANASMGCAGVRDVCRRGGLILASYPVNNPRMKPILIITGDAGESYECLYARHRLLEAGLTPRIAAPSRRRLHLVIHDFEPGRDT